MPLRRAVYAGSFDPLTQGHLWMIREGARLFDELVVAIGTNPQKACTFDLPTRLSFLRASTRRIKNVRAASFENMFLIDFATRIRATHILRGVRNENDYAFERGMRNINGDLNPRITTVFLMPPRDLSEVSSSFVRGLVGPAGWERKIRKYLPAPVYEAYRARFRTSPPLQ